MPPGGQPYNGMPPAAPAYDRMGNGYSSMQGYDNAQQSYNNPPSPPGLKGWEVSCEEEARKALIDLDGSIFVFLDRQTGAIYTKQINPADYSPIFRVYRPEPLPQPAGQLELSGYVTREEFDQFAERLAQLQAGIVPQPDKKAAKETDKK